MPGKELSHLRYHKIIHNILKLFSTSSHIPPTISNELISIVIHQTLYWGKNTVSNPESEMDFVVTISCILRKK